MIQGLVAPTVLVIFCSLPVASQATIVFAGTPSVKISEAGTSRVPEAVSRERAVDVACVISRIGERYYWASREKKEMIRIEKGSFITFVALDGSGYVRIVVPGRKPQIGDTEKFDYVEHMPIGLASVTYYGTTR